jgi:hypothetical protein
VFERRSGLEIECVRFDRLLPLAERFAQAVKYIQDAGTATDVVQCLRSALAGRFYSVVVVVPSAI